MRIQLVGLGGWIKNSLIDYPGTVSTVLFFCGCNLRCPFCHNKDLVECSAAQTVSSGLVWDFLEKRRGLIDGVVISGGEPTLYPYLRDVISEIHAMGYRVKLDTNGLMPQVAKSFAPDYIALDIKTLPSMYGVQLKAGVQDVEGRLADSVNLIRQMGDNAEVRITVAPGIVDLYVVEGLCRLLAGVRKIMLQPMDQRAPLLDPEYNKIAPVPEKEILVMRNMLAKVAEYCGIRGTPG